MKAQDLPFTQLLEGSKQFIIPIFQRTYSWEQSQCEQLWNDIVRVGKDSRLNSHFIGSAVYIPEQETSAAISRWLVIDGQQRITTMTLLLLAFMRKLQAERLEEPVSPELIEDYFLKNRHGKGELRYKMLLTKTDKDTLIYLLDHACLPPKPPEPASHRIVSNYGFFTEKMAGADLAVVYEGIKKLMIVDVRLQQGLDNPQMIFESMNSTGKALTQADLIRNYVLMGLQHELQTRLYDEYWRPMEMEFGAENYISDFDEFMRFYLVIHTKDHAIRRDEVYAAFKGHSQQQDVEKMLGELRTFAEYYCCIALGKEKDPALAAAFHDIRELRADVCYPFLMEVYDDFRLGRLVHGDFVEVVRLVESYVFRRAVCDIPTNSQRQTFATFARHLRKDRYLESVKAAFIRLRSYRRFPSQDEFVRQMKSKNLYAFNRRSYWLRRFENHGRKERVQVQDYTIEHIMPQNESVSADWQAELGPEWKRVHEQYLHTLGNLTLTGYNSEYSDRSFAQKRDMEGGLRQSPLRLNQGLGSCERWNETSIQERAERLARVAADIWTGPELEPTILDVYAVKGDSSGENYELSDHPHLQGGITRELFDALRLEILALDDCVREEIKKLYIAYKAETNFVDVVPKARRLQLSLNLTFSQVDDPRGFCKDVTRLGRWGNGDVEVSLETKEDLPYVMGLVRQALESQLGESSDAGR